MRRWVPIVGGTLVYMVFGITFSLGVLGVGFMPEEQRIWGMHFILFPPVAPAGFVAGFFSKTKPVVAALLTGSIGACLQLLFFLGPLPLMLPSQEPTVPVLLARALYQVSAFLLVAGIFGFIGAKLRHPRNRYGTVGPNISKSARRALAISVGVGAIAGATMLYLAGEHNPQNEFHGAAWSSGGVWFFVFVSWFLVTTTVTFPICWIAFSVAEVGKN